MLQPRVEAFKNLLGFLHEALKDFSAGNTLPEQPRRQAKRLKEAEDLFKIWGRAVSRLWRDYRRRGAIQSLLQNFKDKSSAELVDE